MDEDTRRLQAEIEADLSAGRWAAAAEKLRQIKPNPVAAPAPQSESAPPPVSAAPLAPTPLPAPSRRGRVTQPGKGRARAWMMGGLLAIVVAALLVGLANAVGLLPSPLSPMLPAWTLPAPLGAIGVPARVAAPPGLSPPAAMAAPVAPPRLETVHGTQRVTEEPAASGASIAPTGGATSAQGRGAPPPAPEAGLPAAPAATVAFPAIEVGVETYLAGSPVVGPPTALGARAVADGVALTAHAVARTAAFSPQFPASSGNVNLTVDVTVENVGTADPSAGLWRFKLRGADGLEYPTSFGSRDDVLQVGAVAPGQQAREWISFEVPEAARGFTLFYGPVERFAEYRPFQIRLE
jgi:hypothetical protein